MIVEREDLQLTDVAQSLPLQDMFEEIGGEGATEVSTQAFIRSIIERMKVTFEVARDVVYRILELGRAVLTNQYTLRLAE